jgi:hypothetical protein
MMIWVYQYDQIVQVVTDDQDVQLWVQEAAELFPEAIYFFAELCAW